MKRIIQRIAMVLAGSGGFHTHTGDFSVFLADTLESHGGLLSAHSAATKGLPSSWRAKPDQYGMIICAPHEDFSAINQHLRALFGEPDMWTEENKDGFPVGHYSSGRAGCIIQFSDSKRYAQIIILKAKEGL